MKHFNFDDENTTPLLSNHLASDDVDIPQKRR